MKDENYYRERDINNLKKIERLKGDLPYFIEEFFLGIENRTSTLTRLNYAYDLRIFFDFLSKKKFRNKPIDEYDFNDLEQVTHTDIELFISYLSDYEFKGERMTCSEQAKARKLSTVRSMFKYFFSKGRISVDNAAKVALPKLHDKEIIRLDSEEIGNLLEQAENGEGMSPRQKASHEKTRVRDVAILTLFLGTGIRISELVGINNDDINFQDSSFKITRKGGNQAILYFSEEVHYALIAYKYYKEESGLTDSTAFFLSSTSNKRISIRAVEELVKKYSRMVTPLKKITPHKLRSTYGTQLYRKTKDIYIVADVLGHRDVNTTKKHYAAISEDLRRSVKDAVKLKDDDDE